MKFYTSQDLADIKGVTRQAVYLQVLAKKITPLTNGNGRKMIFDDKALRTFLKIRPGRRKGKRVREQ